jgi:DnaJ-class molecular chaperone
MFYLATFVVIVIAGYALSCWIFPWTHCHRCSGSGRRHLGNRKVFRDCRRCDGTGRRLRIGRLVFNYFRRMAR